MMRYIITNGPKLNESTETGVFNKGLGLELHFRLYGDLFKAAISATMDVNGS